MKSIFIDQDGRAYFFEKQNTSKVDVYVSDIPERPMLSEQYRTAYLYYENDSLLWKIKVNELWVRNDIEKAENELKKNDYKNFKRIQGLISDDEWNRFCKWCEEKRLLINKLEQLLNDQV